MSGPIRVLVSVSGGCVIGVEASEEIVYEVLDFDNLETDDEEEQARIEAAFDEWLEHGLEGGAL